MNLQSLRLGTALKLLLQTTPILLVRLGVSLVFWLVAIIYFGLVFGLAALLANIHPAVGIIAALIGLGATIPLYSLANRYVLYLIKAAHIAVLAELIVNGRLPEGHGQLSWGRAQVTERFGQVSAMFVVDELVNATIRIFTRTVSNVANWLPGDTLRQLANVVNRVIRFATHYIDEAILARTFWERAESPADCAREGLVLYAQAWRPLLTNAVALMLLSYVPFVVVVVLLAAPLGLLLSATVTTTVAAWAVVAMLVLAYLVKVAVGDSFAMAAIIATYHAETKNLTPDPALEARLEQMAEPFRRLGASVGARVPSLG